MAQRVPYRWILIALLLAAGVFAAPAPPVRLRRTGGGRDLGSCTGVVAPCVATTSTPDAVSVATAA